MSDRPGRKSHPFPEKVTEEPIEVIIQTILQRIHGQLDFRAQEQLIDDQDDAPQFLAVTDGRVLRDGQESSLSFDVLLVNRDHIVWILPLRGREAER